MLSRIICLQHSEKNSLEPFPSSAIDLFGMGSFEALHSLYLPLAAMPSVVRITDSVPSHLAGGRPAVLFPP